MMRRRVKPSVVELIDAETNEVMEFYSKIIFLNAATLGTAFILLNSISNRFPNGLGNGSEQVGRNLMDHHKQAGASAKVEGFEDQYYSDEGLLEFIFLVSETSQKKERITYGVLACKAQRVAEVGEVLNRLAKS